MNSLIRKNGLPTRPRRPPPELARTEPCVNPCGWADIDLLGGWGTGVVLDVDALLAHLVGDELLFDDDVLADTHLLDWHDAFLDNGLLGQQQEVELGLDDLSVARRLGRAGLDRLALDHELLPAEWDRERHLLGDNPFTHADSFG